MVTFYYIYCSKYQKKVVQQEISEKNKTENMFHCSEKQFFTVKNMENENTHSKLYQYFSIFHL